MNPLLEQFMSEARELIDASSHAFLELEKSPRDADTLNSLFRYVHTLKGGSGLFDIVPFTRLVHVGEDALSKAREGLIQITPEGIDLYLTILDQLGEWLDELERSDALSDQAPDISDRLTSQIQQCILGISVEDAPAEESAPASSTGLTLQECVTALDMSWLDERRRQSLEQTLAGHCGPVNLLYYRPDEKAFFSGEDPLSFWAGVPDLFWQAIIPDYSYESLESFDPYGCQLRFIGLTGADEQQLKQQLDYIWPSVKLLPLVAGGEPGPLALGWEEVREVLTHQWQILRYLKHNPQQQSTLSSVATVLRGIASKSDLLDALPPLLVQDCLNPQFVPALAKCIKTLGETGDDQAPQAMTDMLSQDAIPQEQAPQAPPQAKGGGQRDDSIRTVKVDQERLEQLVDLAGELIVAKNSLQHLSRRVEQDYGIKALSRDIKSEHAVLNRITESLQDVVMQIRMIPVSTIFQRFPRLVRDLSRRLGKEIDLQVEGEDTEADKNIVEQLSDPLIHLVRNSIDHGIEMPQQRTDKGKSPSGTIRLVAKNIQDSVQIEIHDDGAGIDAEVIKAKAVAKGVISEENAQKLSDNEALHLIFEPGFSTREEVSELSGRGVGMDVVKTTVSRLGGSIDVSSVKDQGSVITVSLPASITVSRVMMFEVNGQVYGIPVEDLTETIKIQPQQIRCIKRREAYVLRDRLIPLYRMHQLLGIVPTVQEQEMPILNLNINGTVAGFVVDRLLEGVDVIIKPLEGVMARFPAYSGAAVLGDGRVLLVINPREMALCH